MRLILPGFILHWKNQLPVGGMPVYSQMVKKQISATQPIEHCVRLKKDNGELLQEVETTMASSS